jgi:uncharacterized protein YlzI (FlbEa/FlbD family)
MRGHKVLPLGVGIIMLSTATFAASATTTGTIEKVDTKSDSITLDNGKVYILSEGVEAESMRIGMKVLVTYRMKNGKMVATSVQALR